MSRCKVGVVNRDGILMGIRIARDLAERGHTAGAIEMICSPAMQTEENAIREIREELYQKQGQGWFRISTGSMRLIIAPGEKVLVRKIIPAAAKLGDIILYRSGEDYITHRLVGFLTREGTVHVLAKGDASSVPEELAPEAVCGKVVLIEKKGGRIFRLDSLRGGIVNGYLGWKNCRFRRLAATADLYRERLRPNPAYPFLRFIYRLVRFPAVALQAMFFKIFL